MNYKSQKTDISDTFQEGRPPPLGPVVYYSGAEIVSKTYFMHPWCFPGPPGPPRASPGCSRLLLAGSGCSWLLLAAPGCSWLLLAAPGCSLAAPGRSLAAPGYSLAAPGRSLAAPGCSRLLPAAPGCCRLLLAAPGCSWLLLVAPGCSPAAPGCSPAAPGCSKLLLAALQRSWLLPSFSRLGQQVCRHLVPNHGFGRFVPTTA
jgi:hypothetical protein